jgi:hypothetical protein
LQLYQFGGGSKVVDALYLGVGAAAEWRDERDEVGEEALLGLLVG